MNKLKNIFTKVQNCLKLFLYKDLGITLYGVTTDDRVLVKKEIFDEMVSDEMKYYQGTFKKRGRTKIEHELMITHINPLEDTASGYIHYTDTNTDGHIVTIPICVLDTFFRKIS